MRIIGGVIAVFSRELSLLRGRKSFAVGVILLPIVSFLFLITLFGDSSLRNMHIAVVDADNSSMSRRYTRMIDATAGVEIAYMPSTVEQGEQLMLEGKVDAVLHIPQDMERSIYRQQKVHPTIYINSMHLLNSSLIYKDIETVTQTLAAGVEMQLLQAAGKSPSEAYQLAIPIYYERHQLFNPYTSYGYYLSSPFNIITVVLCAITFTLFAFGLEYKHNTTRELLLSARGSRFAALVGKMLPYTLYYTLFILVSNFVLYGVMQTPIEGSIWALSLLSLLVVLAYQSFGLIIFALFKKLMLSMSLSAALATMSFTMGGLTFPLMALHLPIYYIAHLFPYTHYIYGYIALIRGSEFSGVLEQMLILIIYPLLLAVLTPSLFKGLLKPYNE